MPDKFYFQNPNFDLQNKTFQGIINFHPKTFDNDVKWIYKAKFDNQLTKIISGKITY